MNKRAETTCAVSVHPKRRCAEKFVLERVSSERVCVNDTISHLINPDASVRGSRSIRHGTISREVQL
ncbi:MAG: hypothetical protein ACLT1J_06450 [Mediterraneibacter gnavus]